MKNKKTKQSKAKKTKKYCYIIKYFFRFLIDFVKDFGIQDFDNDFDIYDFVNDFILKILA